MRQLTAEALEMGAADVAGGVPHRFDDLDEYLGLAAVPALARTRVTLHAFDRTHDLPARSAIALAYRLGRALGAAEVLAPVDEERTAQLPNPARRRAPYLRPAPGES